MNRTAQDTVEPFCLAAFRTMRLYLPAKILDMAGRIRIYNIDSCSICHGRHGAKHPDAEAGPSSQADNEATVGIFPTCFVNDLTN